MEMRINMEEYTISAKIDDAIKKEDPFAKSDPFANNWDTLKTLD